MLRLIGLDQKQIIVVDHYPDYEQIIANDFAEFPDNADLVIIGGQVSLGKLMGEEFILTKLFRGQISSYAVYNFNGRKIILTTYPYGDLCEVTVKHMSQMSLKAFAFVGSSGSLSPDLDIGDIVIPKNIVDEAGIFINHKFQNQFSKIHGNDVKHSMLHTSVITPLVETKSFLHDLKMMGCETIDVEAKHFQIGCEKWLNKNCLVGTLLYVTDKPQSEESIAEHDYSDKVTKETRKRIASILKKEMYLLFTN